MNVTKNAILFLLFAGACFAQPPATNLVGRYVAGTGITSADGRISAWADQSGNSNDLTQADPNLYPYETTDGDARDIVQFRGTNSLVIPAGVALNSRSSTVYVVHRAIRGADSTVSYCLLSGSSNNNFFLRYGTQTDTVPSKLVGISTTSPFLNRIVPVIDGMVLPASGASSWIRNSTVTAHTGLFNSVNFAGGEVGRLPMNTGGDPTSYYYGDIYEILIYSAAQSGADQASTLSYLATTYDIQTPTTQICFEGDSITQGLFANTISWPSYWASTQSVYDRYTAQNRAVSGAAVSDATARADSVDAMLGAGTDVLVVMLGINDMAATGDNLSAEDFLAALETYLEARVTAGWDQIWLCTIINWADAGINTKLETVNPAIRLMGASVPAVTKIIDFAANAAFDAGSFAEEAGSSFVYYQGAGNAHPSNAGAALMAEIFADEIAGTVNIFRSHIFEGLIR